MSGSSDRSEFKQCQRLRIEKDIQGSERNLKIIIERYDDCLGWYTAGSLTLPLHQLPLLQQGLQDVCASPCADCTAEECPKKIIPFPSLIALPKTLEEKAAEQGS